MYLRIDPEFFNEMAPVLEDNQPFEWDEHVRAQLIRTLNQEMQTIMDMVHEIGDDAKLTAADVRLILSLRGFNLCA